MKFNHHHPNINKTVRKFKDEALERNVNTTGIDYTNPRHVQYVVNRIINFHRKY